MGKHRGKDGRRLDALNTLKSKYGRTLEDVQEYLDGLKEKQRYFEQYEKRRAAAEQDLIEAEREVASASEELSVCRRQISEELAEKIREGLRHLNFLSADLEIAFSRSGTFRRDGYDDIEFLISTNPGEPVRPLAKIASGGELSRIMLAIKALLADKDRTETLIFDEIDTGVSGRTAQRVAEKMEEIGRSHQVLCVTHLAQIAAMADHHFLITKEAEGGSTKTLIDELTEKESVEEIARILGSDGAKDAAMKNAQEMRAAARQKKAG